MATANTIDAKLAKQFTGDIERLLDEMESKKGEYMSWCKTQRELINQHYDRAKDAGIPKAALKAVIKVRELEGRIEEARENLEDDVDLFDQIRTALGDFGDTGLGAAALANAKEKSKPIGMPGAH